MILVLSIKSSIDFFTLLLIGYAFKTLISIGSASVKYDVC
jgi:hypothetical protein